MIMEIQGTQTRRRVSWQATMSGVATHKTAILINTDDNKNLITQMFSLVLLINLSLFPEYLQKIPVTCDKKKTMSGLYRLLVRYVDTGV
jgi:hypothetical protein